MSSRFRVGRYGWGAAVVVAAALVATAVVASPASAANQLSFGDAPAGWSVTSGEADADLGTVRATGVKKNRIRYSLQGSAGFAVRPRSGVVSYDGTELPAGEALLTITARDRKGKVADASVTITVSVTAAQPAPQLERHQPPALPHSTGFDHDHVKVKVNTRRPMIAEGRSQAVMVRLTADVPDDTSAEYRIVGGGHSLSRPSSGKWLSTRDGFELNIDTGVLEYTGSGTPFEGTGSRTLTISGQKDYYEYFLQVEVTAPGYTKTTIDIRVCLLR